MEQNDVLQSTAPVEITDAPNDYQVSTKKGSSMRVAGLVGVFVLIVLAGIGTGFGLNSLIKGNSTVIDGNLTGAPGTITASEVVVGQTYGAENGKKFPDSVEGIVEKGGMEGEGTHHLIRPGGKSQTVYMTSSVVDLDLFIGHKVQLMGETFSAQKAAWFMDVGSVKVVQLNAKSDDTAAQEVPAE